MTIKTDDLIITSIIASLGYVTANARCLTVGLKKEDHIVLRVFFDGDISDANHEAVACMETELWAAFDPSDGIDAQAIRCDSPKLINWTDHLIYHRYEPSFRLEKEPFRYGRLDSTKSDAVATWIVGIRAMLGAIFPELRRTYLYCDRLPFILIFYVEGKTSPLTMQLMQQVQAFIIDHLDGGSNPELVDLQIEQCDYPSKIPDQEQCVLSLYSRYDPIP